MNVVGRERRDVVYAIAEVRRKALVEATDPRYVVADVVARLRSSLDDTAPPPRWLRWGYASAATITEHEDPIENARRYLAHAVVRLRFIGRRRSPRPRGRQR